MSEITLVLDGEPHRLEILRGHPALRVRLDGQIHEIEAIRHGRHVTQLRVDGHEVEVVAAGDDSLVHLRMGGRTLTVEVPDPRDAPSTGPGSGDAIVADMPGMVVRLAKAEGDTVQAGECVLTIESMKLQMNLGAPRAGVIARVLVQANQSFDKGTRLVELLAAEGP